MLNDEQAAVFARLIAECAGAAAEIERLSVDYDQAYSDGRSMLIHEFKTVCDQRDALLTKADLPSGTGDERAFDLGYESCRRFIGDFHGPVVRALNDCIKENQQLTAERDSLRKEVEALRADAGRYRWLRLNSNDERVYDDTFSDVLHAERLDAAIDAAMKAGE